SSDYVPGLNPLAAFGSAGRRDLVPVDGSAEAQAEGMVRLGEQTGQPRTIVIIVTEVSPSADDRTPPISQSEVVIQIQSAGGRGPFDQRPDEVHRNEPAAELNHLRPADRGLQPLAMMEFRIPVIDRSVVAAE